MGDLHRTNGGIWLVLATGAWLFAMPFAHASDFATKWGAHLEIEGRVSSARTLGDAALFAPLWQNDTSLLFADVRARFDDNSNREGNFGVGLRHMLDKGWNIGGYGYFDVRRSVHDNTFRQLTLGIEALNADFELRLNGYLPIGQRTHDTGQAATASIFGTNIWIQGTEEHALAGFDGEIGWRLPILDPSDATQIRAYAGGFYFDSDKVDEAIAGPRGRLEVSFDGLSDLIGMAEGTRLTVGAELQHDNVRGTEASAIARLRIPLGPAGRSGHLTAQESRMTERVVRDLDVVTQVTGGPAELATQTADGRSLSVISSSTTTGADLASAVAGAGANSHVILSGTFDTNAPVRLQTGQTLMGAGATIVSSASGRSATLYTQAATINSAISGNQAAVEMADYSTFSGMVVHRQNPGSFGNPIAIVARNVNHATITNNAVSTTSAGHTAFGISARWSNNVTIADNIVAVEHYTDGNVTGVQMFMSSGTVRGNSIDARASDVVNTRAVHIYEANIFTGSTGNTIVNGRCDAAAPGFGVAVEFTNAPACGP